MLFKKYNKKPPTSFAAQTSPKGRIPWETIPLPRPATAGLSGKGRMKWGQGFCEKKQLQLFTSPCLALEKLRLIEEKVKKRFEKIALYVIWEHKILDI